MNKLVQNKNRIRRDKIESRPGYFSKISILSTFKYTRQYLIASGHVQIITGRRRNSLFGNFGFCKNMFTL